MLKVMRRQLKSLYWVLWLVIASFVLSFVFFQLGMGGGGPVAGGSDWAAMVDDEVVTYAEYVDAFQRQEETLRQLLGAQYDRSRFMDPGTVVGALVDRVLLRQEARRAGMRVSPSEIARTIRDIPAFQTAEGRFDRDLYDNYIRQVRTTHGEFEARIADDLLVGKMAALLRAAATVSDAELRNAWLEQNETVTVELLTITGESSDEDVEVSESQAREWYAAHADDYDGGPGRLVRWVLFDRAAAREALEDEAEMRAYYEENLSSIYMMGSEMRRASRILVTVEPGADEEARAAARERAEAVARRARRGEDFATLARDLSDDARTREAGGDLGGFYEGLLGPEADAAVFAAAEGDVLGPFEAEDGFEVLLVTKGPGEKPYAFPEVRDRIGRALYGARASDQIREGLDAFLAALDQDPDFEAAATAVGLEASPETWVSAGGAIPGLEDDPAVVSAVFATGVGQLTEPQTTTRGRVVLTVLDSRESSPQSFERAREAVEADVRADLARRAARAEAERLVGELDGATPLADQVAGREVQTAGPFRRGTFVPGIGVAEELNRAAFSTPVGTLGPLVDTEAGAVAFRVTEHVEFDPVRFEADAPALRTRLENERYQAHRQASLAALRERHEDVIVINDALLGSLTGQPGQG